jgi:hypothetical protein
VAAGGDTNGYGLIETLSDGSWTATEVPLPPNLPGNQTSLSLVSVACPAIGSCVALGQFSPSASLGPQMFTETQTDGSWTAASPVLPANSTGYEVQEWEGVTCPAIGSCEAVGSLWKGIGCSVVCGLSIALVDTLAGSTWTAADTPMPANASSQYPNASYQAVTCPAASSCLAVGQYLDNNNDYQGFVETLANGSWSPTEPPLPANAISGDLVAVSCAQVGVCVAVGEYQVEENNDLALVESLSGGSWTPTTVPMPAGYESAVQSGLSDVSCPTTGSCVAVGDFLDASIDQHGLIETGLDGSWSATEAPLPPYGAVAGNSPPDLPETYLDEVSCPTVSSCAAIGTFPVPVDDLPNVTFQASLIETIATPTVTSFTTLSSSTATSTYGQAVTFTATVFPSDGDGTVGFAADGTTIIGCADELLVSTADGYQATCTTTSLSVGTHSITASYSGDLIYLASSAGSTSQEVIPATPTVTVTDNSPSTAPGATLTFATAVAGTIAYPTGTVTWKVTGPGGTAQTCNSTSGPVYAGDNVSDYTCSITDSPQGTYSATAAYSGDNNYNPDSGVDDNASVEFGAQQTITFTTNPPSDATYGTATYTVSASGGGSGNPVTLSIDPSATSVCSLSGDTVSFIGPGTCVIDANQAGNTDYDAAPQAQQTFRIYPGTLIQGSLAFARVAYGTACADQLSVSDPAADGGSTTWTTTNPSSAVTVSSSGAVSDPASTLPGSYIVSGTMADSAGDTGTWIFTLVVLGSSPTITGTPPSLVAAGTAYNYTFDLTGTPVPTTTVTSGQLPPGLSLSSSGVISGTPTTPGSYTTTMTAANSVNPNATTTFTIVVIPTASLSVPSGAPGTAETITGAGYQAAETVKVTYTTGLTSPNKVTLCTATVASNGTFTCNAHIPTRSTAGANGNHKITIKGTTSGSKVKITFTLT